MLTLQHSLGEISVNIVWGKELTPKIRGKILGMHKAGYNILYIIV